MFASRIVLIGVLLLPSLACAGVINLDFEGLADGTILTNQYVGFLFTNAIIETAGLSLNDLEFPPRSGTNVVADDGGLMTIEFASPVLTFSGFFTYSSPLTIDAFDALNQSVGTTNSAFSANYVSSGNPPNELLQVSFAGGISGVSITGNLAGSSFALDDVTITTPVSGPEPSSGFMVAGSLVLVCLLGRARGRVPIK